MKTSIPIPPQRFVDGPEAFIPAKDLDTFVWNSFLSESSKLHNPDHEHLIHAEIGYLWTNQKYEKKGKRILGTAEQVKIGNKWSDGRKAQQIYDFFAEIPDFIITIDAVWFAQADNPSRCALLEHELYHCAQAKDQYGYPKFSNQTGLPVFTIAPHDVEEFIGVVKRYGSEATDITELIRVANKGPEIAKADINGICGSCMKSVA
jgi:hypothetical protein